MAASLRGPARVAILTCGGLDGDSRALRVATAARAAGYEVTVIGRPPATLAVPDVEVRPVTVRHILGTHRVRRPHPALRWPLAYRSTESYEHRTTLIAARRSLLRTRGAELVLVHRALPLLALARLGYGIAWLRYGLRSAWTGVRAAQYRTAVRHRGHPASRLDDLAAEAARLLLGRRAWRRLDPGLLDEEVAYGPVLDDVRPHLIHAIGHRALGLAIRAALRSEGSGHRIEVVWDAPPRIPAATRRATVAGDAHERSFAKEADGVVTVGDRLARELRARHQLAATPTVVRNAPPLIEVGEHPDGVRRRCHLAGDVPLLVHTGPLNPDRGADTVIDALPKLYDLHAAFVVPDPAHPDVAALRERAEQLGVHARLHVLPYVPVPDIPAFLSSADIGVLPVHKVAHHQSVLATRYYEFAHARLPVVVSDVRAMANATLELGNGEVFRARDTADFVRAVGAVLTNPKRYRKAYDRVDVLRQWSWQTESAPLIDLYARLLGPRP
ncbi:glycosyltransferase family 4 protein [Streptomyces sp. KK5PA1]|uniref:D-inositol 3-phosphate glycosyltransferase n=2 Tax=Actinacidiphila acididurans TaxID=2784346 RepID=A0ABS2TMR9_9ACTN|nr:glycosyltransferase family 4 protein [Actinacidiphila acididurans]